MKRTLVATERVSPSRIAVLFTSADRPSTEISADERESGDLSTTADAVSGALRGFGHSVRKIEFGNDTRKLVARLSAWRPDIVFNLAEGPLDAYAKEPHAAALLELLGLPYTGNGPVPLALCKDKGLTKRILLAHGLPTPRFQVCSTRPPTKTTLTFPLVVKPLLEDGSLGIAEESVVANQEELQSRVSAVIAQHRQKVLVEEFVGGREFNVVVLGNGTAGDPYHALPPGEYVYHSDRWRICTFAAKWDVDHPSYAAIEACYPARISAALRHPLKHLALECARIFELTGYARMDFRLNGAGDPQILDINPNPDLLPDAGTARTGQLTGWSYPEFLQQIVRLGLARGVR